LEQCEEKERVAWQKEHLILLKSPFESSNELKDRIGKKKTLYQFVWKSIIETIDEQQKAWEHSIPKIMGKGGKFHYDLTRLRSVREPDEGQPVLQTQV
jgi:hypothetical protein